MRKLILQNSAVNLSLRAGRESFGRKNSWVQKILLLALVVQLCAAGSLKAQAYGSGADGSITVSTTVYTDDVRAQCVSQTGFNNFGINPPTLPFSVGDFVIIVQMSGTGSIGTYTGATINNISGGGTSIDVTPFNGPNCPSFDAANSQMIRVPQWTKVTIQDGGLITCHDFDGQTGGVLCFLADDSLIFTSVSHTFTGKIVAGYGYNFPGAGGARGVHQSGGTHGAEGTSGSHNGAPGSKPSGGTTGGGAIGQHPPYTICAGAAGGNGGEGGGANEFGGSGGTGLSPVAYAITSSYKSIMGLGDPGNGGNGGAGGGAGGGGGGGGYSLGSGISDGHVGINGLDGGLGGVGGVGGGIIYIRASTIYVNGTAPQALIVARGQEGSAGENAPASDGTNLAGKGGDGGGGAYGGCGPMSSGIGGGKGYTGNGASGGSGGQGGCGGTIWVAFANTSNLATNAVDASKGSGGAAGVHADPLAPGLRSMNGTSTIYDLSACGYPGTIYCDIVNTVVQCDPFDAFCNLVNMTGATIYGTDSIVFTGGSQYRAVYNETVSPRVLSTYVSTVTPRTSTSPQFTTTTDYTCTLVAGSDCDVQLTYIADSTGGTCSGSTVSYTTGSTYSTSFPSFLLYGFAPHYSCGVDACPTLGCTGDCPSAGSDGSVGMSGALDGTVSYQNQEPANGSSFKRAPAGIAMDSSPVFTLKLQPNPAHTTLNMSFDAALPAVYSINIYDMGGKHVLGQKYNTVSGKNANSIDISSLAPGSYIFNMSSGSISATKRFEVQ